MQISGILPEDAPDPRIEAGRRLRALPFAPMRLVPQKTLEEASPSFAEGTDARGRHLLEVALSYRLWRAPDDPDDPTNLRDLDERERAAIESTPPWPRPAWLIEQVEAMRYPHLWEAVRTTWDRDVSERTTVAAHLIQHTNHILVNQFREELGLAPGPTASGPWQVRPSAVNDSARLEIDGVDVPASEIDTDPFVYAVGAQIDPQIVVTAVIARDDLPFVRLALTSASGTID